MAIAGERGGRVGRGGRAGSADGLDRRNHPRPDRGRSTGGADCQIGRCGTCLRLPHPEPLKAAHFAAADAQQPSQPFPSSLN